MDAVWVRHRADTGHLEPYSLRLEMQNRPSGNLHAVPLYERPGEEPDRRERVQDMSVSCVILQREKCCEPMEAPV